VQLDPIKPTLKPSVAICLKLKCDTLLSTFAFNFNLRRYTMGTWADVCEDGTTCPDFSWWGGAS